MEVDADVGLEVGSSAACMLGIELWASVWVVTALQAARTRPALASTAPATMRGVRVIMRT